MWDDNGNFFGEGSDESLTFSDYKKLTCGALVASFLLGIGVHSSNGRPLDSVTAPVGANVKAIHRILSEEPNTTFENVGTETAPIFQKEVTTGYFFLIGAHASETTTTISPQDRTSCTKRDATNSFLAIGHHNKQPEKCKLVSKQFIISAAEKSGYTGELTIHGMNGHTTTHSITPNQAFH